MLLLLLIFCSSHLRIIVALFLLLSPSLGVTRIQGHTRLFCPLPSPLRHVPLFLSREDFRPIFPRRLASDCAGMGSSVPQSAENPKWLTTLMTDTENEKQSTQLASSRRRAIIPAKAFINSAPLPLLPISLHPSLLPLPHSLPPRPPRDITTLLSPAKHRERNEASPPTPSLPPNIVTYLTGITQGMKQSNPPH